MISIALFSAIAPRQLKVSPAQEHPALAMMQYASGSASRITLSSDDSLHVEITGKLLNVFANGKRHKDVAQLTLTCPDLCEMRLVIDPYINRVYRGNILIQPFVNTISVVLNTEENLAVSSIVMSEMREFEEHQDALKAFAVVARTFARAGKRHPEQAADLCDTTHCQVYQALSPSKSVLAAVEATANVTLAYRNLTFRPYYSRACGGRTATYESVWNKQPSGYQFAAVDCPCARESFDWNYTVDRTRLGSIVQIENPVMTVESRTVVLSNQHRTIRMPAENFRALLGRHISWKAIKSNRFQVSSVSHKDIHIQGSGIGHSVGFCQTGASLLAASGVHFDEILRHYFPNTELRSVSE